MPLTILLNGAKGRMGRAVATAAAELGLVIGAATDAGEDPAAGLARCDVMIDFSSPSATGRRLELAAAHDKPIVIGTTGYAAGERKKLLALAARVPCVW